MEIKHPYIETLLACLDLEELEQTKRFQLDEQHNLKSLKAEGLAIHPIRINRKTFGYADYPELNFRIPFPAETGNFRDGMAIECFCQGEEPVKGMLLNLDGKQGEIRLFAPDFPDWIEEEGVGIKLTPDTRTTTLMKKALNELYLHPNQQSLFNKIHADQTVENIIPEHKNSIIENFFNKNLNESQLNAVNQIQDFEELLIIHGPPGTGKTTTLIEAILQLVKKGEKILVSAPSNTAVDNIASGLIDKNINFIRVGNNTKVNAQIFPFTPEGKLKDSKQEKEIKKLKIRAVEFRKMANQYKRRFGKDERDQRNLLIKEVKSIRKEIKDIQNYNEEQLFENARVIIGTPIGLMDGQVQKLDYQTLIIDEAGQCLEPLAWCIIPLAEKVILAGDHLQLPPTILSDKAAQLGLRHSILEVCFSKIDQIYLLDTQYRMRESIAQFSNEYFYDGKLKTPIHLLNTGEHITFYDTAGAGFDEERGPDGTSLMNKGEIDIILKIIEKDNLQLNNTAVISPYSGQVTLAKDLLKSTLRISTIDSFQGQEEENVIISLVRSNNEGQIGFLKDYRRMNVAMTRAKEKLIIIGDSSTLAKDPYYAAFIDYIEKINAYKSVWEII
jgi:superfamily I DNA and/or RNA helicase